MKQEIQKKFIIPHECAGKRLDQVVSELLPDYSRGLLQTWIKSGELKVNSKTVKPKFKLLGSEVIELNAELEEQEEWLAEDIELDIIYEDQDIFIINKPANLVVHPAAGNWTGTLLNALLFKEPRQSLLPRAGIVHRLDKDTSGLMVVAKSMAAQTRLVQQIQRKEVVRKYQALVIGEMTGGREIDLAIARHPSQRTKMTVDEQGKQALTHVRLIERFKHFTYISAQLDTGRTHQIRVHMSHIGYPLIGDSAYGGANRLPKAASEALKEALYSFKRQALHSTFLALEHPITGEYMEWSQKAPADFEMLLEVISKECAL